MLASRLTSHAGEGLGGLDFYVGFAIISVKDAGIDPCSKRRAIQEVNTMQYVNFGTTGLQISRLGFGGIPIQRIDQPGTRELLIAAHKAGINYIDTARAYTVSEAWIGQSLEEAGLRDDFILATKCRA